MRVALLSYNAQLHNAVGNLLAEKVRFFLDRGAEVRLFVEDARRLHPDLRACCIEVIHPAVAGPEWDYLRQCDLILAVYAQTYDLLLWLPCLAGGTGRIVLEYLGVTPPHLWPDQHREGIQTSLQKRGFVWCADHALAISPFIRRELLDATHFPEEFAATLPLSVDLERFRRASPERFLHERFKIEGRILLYVGRLAGNKRAPLLIEALARLDDASFHAVFVGDNGDVYAAEEARCRERARQLGLAERVHFAGSLADADLPRAFRSAAALVMPSLHEGFCVPVIEAMACGIPVVASRSAALPGTVGDAGLTFVPDDADDLSRQLKRVLNETSPALALPKERNERKRRIAVVSFRFGAEIVGGAETSLRTMAHALERAGHQVEVFTTCTKSESSWKNELPAGTVTLDGLPVHRFAVDAHDPIAHGGIYRGILEAQGRVTAETERDYLRHSLHSSDLLAALQARQGEFDAIITGPYLFGLTADIVRAFAEKTLLVPCFHDEALAYLDAWPRLFGEAGGILFHSPEEQRFAQERLGVNHPNSREIGTFLASSSSSPIKLEASRPYLVYCGRYCEEKNLSLLLEWARRHQADHPERFEIVFMGQGNVKIPAEPWLRDLGRVEESTKRVVLAGAKALIQLSKHESLSLVVLEAWAEGTPVIVHRDCPVLAGQIERSQGGLAVADYQAFAVALDDLWRHDAVWIRRGEKGRAYVAERYADANAYVERLLGAVDQMRKPLAKQMSERGVERAKQFSRERWQRRFGEFVESVLTHPARPYREEVRIEPLRESCRAALGMRTLLVPVRLSNAGTHALAAVGPGRTVLCAVVREQETQRVVKTRIEIDLPALGMPGQAHVAALPVQVPHVAGGYRLLLWTERKAALTQSRGNEIALPLTVEASRESSSSSCASVFLETVREILPRTHASRKLPSDYVDVTEGHFASLKRFAKRKLLNNFKQGYVDVLSRQQSQVNDQFVLMIQQLTECCTMLDQAVSGVHRRLDALETKIDKLAAQTPESATEVVS